MILETKVSVTQTLTRTRLQCKVRCLLWVTAKSSFENCHSTNSVPLAEPRTPPTFPSVPFTCRVTLPPLDIPPEAPLPTEACPHFPEWKPFLLLHVLDCCCPSLGSGPQAWHTAGVAQASAFPSRIHRAAAASSSARLSKSVP